MAESSKRAASRKSAAPKKSRKAAPPPRRTVVLVVGMHRSGTSAMTRVLDLAGLTLPEKLMEAKSDNEAGFWEPVEIVEAHDRFLTDLGVTYDAMTTLPDGFASGAPAQTLIEDIEYIVNQVPGRGPVVIKDPRVARLLPVWKEAARRQRFTLKVVFMVRNPLEVAASLEKRSGFSYDKALLLWLIYNLEAEEASRDLPRAFVEFEALLSDWKPEVKRIASALSLTQISVTAAASKKISDFLSRDLKHHTYKLGSVRRDPRCSDWVRDLYSALRRAASGLDPDIAAKAEPVRLAALPAIDTLGRVVRVKDDDLYAVTQEKSRLQNEQENERQRLDETLDEVRAKLEESRNERQQLDSALAQARAENEDLHREASQLRETNHTLTDEVRAAVRVSETLSLDMESNRKRLDALTAEAASASTEARMLKDRLDEVVREAEAAKKAREEAAQDAMAARLEARAMTERLAAAREDVSDLQENVEQLSQERERLRREFQESERLAREERDRLRAELQHSEQRVHQEQERLQAAESKLRETGEAVRRLENERLEWERRTRTLITETGALEARVEDAQRELEEQQRQNAEIINERDRLENERLEWERRAEWLSGREESRRGVGWKLKNALMRAGGVSRFTAMSAGLSDNALLPNPARSLKLHRQSEAIRASGMFDEKAYLAANWDVKISGQDPVMHYLMTGAAEGRDPGPLFDTKFYLERYPDVRETGMNPLYHYIRFGREEGRHALPPRNGGEPDPLAAAIDPYSVRPDDCVTPEIQRGEAFLDAHRLLSEDPDYAGASAFLETAARSPAIVAPGGVAQPDASIVIPVYGQLAYTLNCLDSLRRHESRSRFEVIVYDDCSPESDTRTHLEPLSWVRFVRAEKNGGFIKACNSGAAHARGRIFVMLNNDTRVVPGWLDGLMDSFQRFDRAGLVGSKLFYPDGSLQEAGGIVWRDGSAWNYGRNDDPGKPEYCHARRADYCSGASIAVRADLWREMGGFDGETYERAYYEDTDLAFRLRDAGWETWFQPLSRLVHYEGKTSGTDEGAGEKAYQASNRERFLKRWRRVLDHHAPNGENPWREACRAHQRIVLLIDAVTPTPDQDSGSLDAVNLMEMLRELDYLPVFAPEDNMLFFGGYTQSLQASGVQCLYHPYNTQLDGFLEARGQDLDAVILHRLEPARKWFDKVRTHAPGARLIYNTVDLHHIRERREAELKGDEALFQHARRNEKTELDLIRRADGAIVVSSAEKDLLNASAPDSKVVHMPLIREAPGRRKAFEDRSGMVFVGGFAHAPNRDAVEYFLAEIWPALQQRLPGAPFRIVGSKMPDDLREAARRAGADPVGFVPDLDAALEEARLMVAPLRYGAGAKGKVISALSHGLPCVASPIAAEGMDEDGDNGLLVAHDPSEWIDMIGRLHEDAAHWRHASDHAVRFARARHSIARGMTILREELRL